MCNCDGIRWRCDHNVVLQQNFLQFVITCKPFRLVYLIVVALDVGAPSPQTFEFWKFAVFIKLDTQVMFNLQTWVSKLE